MGHKSSEFEKELYSRIDEVVHYIWDPIGVSSFPGARDEYYSYLPEIHEYVKSGDTAALKKYMTWLAIEHMGLNDNQDSTQAAISIILEWKAFLESKYPNDTTAKIG
jgi:hypothetical protein